MPMKTRLCLPYISPTSRLYLPYISAISPLHHLQQEAHVVVEARGEAHHVQDHRGRRRLQGGEGVLTSGRLAVPLSLSLGLTLKVPVSRYRGDIGETWGRYRGDIGEI